MSIVKVAKLAGCSHATVSRVINGHPNVSEETVAQVRAAMRRLNFTPSARRRGPRPKHRPSLGRSERAGNVMLLMFGTEASPTASPVASVAIHTAEEALADNDCMLTIGQLKEGSRLPAAVLRGDVDGLILHGQAPPPEVADQLKPFPSVWIMSPRSNRGYWGDRVAPDHEAIGRCAASHLIESGHRRIGFLYIDRSHRGYQTRAEAFCASADEAGVQADIIGGDQVAEDCHCDIATLRTSVQTVIERFVQMSDRPTGLFVPKGQATLAVYEALRKHDIQPGRDVTIISCDNDPILQGLDPMPAAIDVRPDRIARTAVNHLLYKIKEPQPHARSLILIEPSLISPASNNAGV